MERKHVSLRQEDIERIDKYAKKRNIKRSEALRRILDEYFGDSAVKGTGDGE